MVTVGSIMRGTFQFVRSNIVSILIWSLLLLVSSLLMMAMMRPVYEARLATLQTGVTVAPYFGPAFWVGFPVMAILMIVIWAAGFRAVLRPAETRFFYLRLGMDELRLLGLFLVLALIAFLAEVVAVVAVIVIGIVLGLVLGKMAAAVVGTVIGIALACACVWAIVRISPAGPLTILERRIDIGAAWRLSRGHFWPLFGAYLVIALIVLAFYLLVMAAQMGPILADMARPTDPDAVRRVAEWQLAHLQFGASMLIYAIATTLIYGVSVALQVGMTAVATRELLGQRSQAQPASGPWSN